MYILDFQLLDGLLAGFIRLLNYIIAGDEDYEPGPFTVIVSAGDISSVSFNITIIDDDVFEANESFILIIDPSTVPSRVIVQPHCMTVVTIVDDDKGE